MAALPVTVKILIDGALVDITSDVLAGERIQIRRGRTDERSSITAAACTLTLNDPTEKYNNKNPASPYYGKVGRNTRIEVAVDSDVRFYGEVSAWAPTWDETGNRITVNVEAAGVLRRLEQGAQQVKSPLRLHIPSHTGGSPPVAYWPMEDGTDATELAAVLGHPAAYTGLNLASDSDLKGSLPLPTMPADSAIIAHAPAISGTPNEFGESWSMVWVMKIPEAPAGTDQTLMEWTAAWPTVKYKLVLTTGGNVKVLAYNNTGVEMLADTGWAFEPDSADIANAGRSWTSYGQWLTWLFFPIKIGSDSLLNYRWTRYFPDGFDYAKSGSVFLTGETANPPKRISIYSGTHTMSIGHLAVFDTLAVLSETVAHGFIGETAGRRVERICNENGITVTVIGNPDNTGRMGPQAIDTPLRILEGCATVDQGILFETRTGLGLTYRCGNSLQNQTPDVELDYSLRHLVAEFRPADDDQAIWNSVTATRPDGQSYTSVQTVGPLSTQEPPDGVGVYDRGAVTAYVADDDQLPGVAGWIRHLGTVDEQRYPSVSVNLAAPVWDADATRKAQVVALDAGDLVRLNNVPIWTPTDPLVLMQVQGYAEVLESHRWTVQYNMAPGWPWEVWQLNTGGSTIVAPVTSNGTSLKLATSAGPAWSTTAEPYHLIASGNAMTVTAMTTDTPAFIAAGAASHAVNASVTPGLPAGMTVDNGQILLLKAAIRNSGTGVPNTPTNWTRLAVYGASDNVQWFYRYYATGYSGPTVSFTGGVANADTSAQIYGFSGLSHVLDGTAATQLNGSAANIAYPALTTRKDATSYRRANSGVIVSGWRQQDWTSVATLAGFAELGEPDTGTGDNQGFVADFLVQATATTVPAGSFVVTGGVNGISRSAAFALRPLQTATVTRNVNGVSTAISAGAAVEGWRMGAIAL